MEPTKPSPAPPQIAVWWFVGATFIFAAPALFSFDAPVWARVVLLVAGFVAVICGGIQLGRELRQRRDSRAEPPQIDE